MENRLKERLTGAAILVALVVLIVPELLRGGGSARTSAARSAAVHTGATITSPIETDGGKLVAGQAAAPPAATAATAPDGTAAEQSFTIDLSSPPGVKAPTRTEAAIPAPDTSSESQSQATVTSGGAPEALPAPLAAPVAAGAAAAHEASASHKVPVTPSPAVHKAPAIHEAPSTAPVAAREGWMVQLGLFAQADNAQRLLHRAREHGYHAQLARSGPHRLYRVWISGLPDRAHAEQLSRRLHAQGFAAAVLRR